MDIQRTITGTRYRFLFTTTKDHSTASTSEKEKSKTTEDPIEESALQTTIVPEEQVTAGPSSLHTIEENTTIRRHPLTIPEVTRRIPNPRYQGYSHRWSAYHTDQYRKHITKLKKTLRRQGIDDTNVIKTQKTDHKNKRLVRGPDGKFLRQI